MEAAAIGPAVPPGCFPVEVHSVFHAAVNLQPCRGGRLITVLSQESSDLPQSIRLATTEDFTTHRLEPRAMGHFQEDGVSLARAGATTPFRITFSKATRLPAESLPSIQQLGESWKAGLDLLGRLQAQACADLRIGALVGQDLVLGFLGQRLTRAALDLGGSVQAASLASANKAIAHLVGLGSGLTPSGDDFLCGFVTAAHCRLQGHSDRLPFLRELITIVLEWLPNTNAISGTFLRCAVEGRAGKAVQNLAEAMATDLRGGPHSRSALKSLCAFGHSSGMDIATGFLYGLAVWE